MPQLPVAVDDNYQVFHNQTLTVSAAARGLLANDYGASDASLTLTYYVAATHGSVATINPNGTFSYVPGTNYTGSDTFTYFISDSNT